MSIECSYDNGESWTELKNIEQQPEEGTWLRFSANDGSLEHLYNLIMQGHLDPEDLSLKTCLPLWVVESILDDHGSTQSYKSFAQEYKVLCKIKKCLLENNCLLVL